MAASLINYLGRFSRFQ